MTAGAWTPLATTRQLVLWFTLDNGQCFNWKRVGLGAASRTTQSAQSFGKDELQQTLADTTAQEVTEHTKEDAAFHARTNDAHGYVGVVQGLAVHLREAAGHVEFRVLGRATDKDAARPQRTNVQDEDQARRVLGDYFQLDTDMSTLCRDWSAVCPRIAAVNQKELRSMGFGYRAKYIVNSLKKLHEQQGGPHAWLRRLRDLDQSAESLRLVREALLTLDGVGPKVADCVALFCLDRKSVIPVDTHVWQIACRDFDPELIHAKSLTPKIYERVGNLFRDRYGAHAGWAHSLLFAAELPQFLELLPKEMQKQLAAFALEEKARKAQLRREKKSSTAPIVKKEEVYAPAAKSNDMRTVYNFVAP
ncbi:N-glycosylase/DNA lyase [Hondaea fermentalgiana]|uniref:DNA-(apurinic or apyrimidinic site) lyase n=1 Tax=Hondaea fermentalgiana TaxID=2315210 RepID=A0A2R5G9F4_9STRA|nr:N-glycosylase/DNA lyase [Hondaea fermentalgiana]|eukprot:GBG27666.1 N-glycosylase/DNA lyase [Hondaea fermentalgiana]